MAENSVQSVERTFALLELLARHPGGVGLVEAAALAGLHKSTAHRLLSCLSGMGYAVKDSGTGRYKLTYKVLELSKGMLEDVDVLSAAKPHLDALSARTGETVHLMVPKGDQGIYIYKSDTTGQGQMRSRVGLGVPLIHTAAGKAILSTLPAQEVRTLWDGSDHTPRTGQTVTTWDAFWGQIETARVRSWAMDDEENEPGVRCVGTAIPDYTGRGLAGVSISANAARMTSQRVRELTPLLLECRGRICHDMGL